VGRSDPYVFEAYKKFFNLYNEFMEFKDVCVLGQPNFNSFTNSIISTNKQYYDISLDNWDINKFPYRIKEKFDLVICTRCSYFCSQPQLFLKECHKLLKPSGKIFVDWGLGDHLRFENFRVGFKDENFHEYGYFKDNYLYSCLWDPTFISAPQVNLFSERILKFGYNDLNATVYKEVPAVLSLEDVRQFFKNVAVHFLTLWEEQPQLYIILQGESLE
jgi:SAM-dependent methyltransferase